MNPSLEFSLREAEPADAAALIAYVRRVADETPFLTFAGHEFDMTVEREVAVIEEHRAADNRIFVVAERAGEILGILNVVASQKPRLRHIAEFGMTVRKAYWNRGVGGALLGYLIDWARANPLIRKINLNVHTENAAAIHLYRKFGFEIEGRIRRDLYNDGEFSDTFAMGLLI